MFTDKSEPRLGAALRMPDGGRRGDLAWQQCVDDALELCGRAGRPRGRLQTSRAANRGEPGPLGARCSLPVASERELHRFELNLP